jgi:hypothetical protein
MPSFVTAAARSSGRIQMKMFTPAVGIAFAKRPDALPDGFLEDRAKFSGRNIDRAAIDGGSAQPARSAARALLLT